ncbi:MAG TPA: bifunctional diaminohydroxyphosphoribosylaminopyrimidine deaminase/5-amino-6-(5-phosphoribosylamino)uracil reductase RibD [Longimicrobiaceae bacterium]|nr:bifunctional diaminohydroxyphosphoribosylaminopyrimidine deaminase/5-amino-6-(5-phosphoribosylamino)uracil reductase RibD [Longimicrobiaceae bacterium]
MTADGEDLRHMRRALDLARRGWGRVAPNPLVGAVIVRDGEVVGEGWHTEYGQPHAEVEALRQAGERARGATAYVTLEPCAHFGKTPPCADALIEAGVARVVIACRDPNPEAEGGAERLRRAGVEVEADVEEQAARDLNAPFFHAHSPAGESRPWVHLKLALSLDARIADAAGRSQWVTGEAARAEVHRLRAGHDAVAVGIATALADDPTLTVRGEVQPRVAPVRVVFDRALRLAPDSRLARSAGEVPVWLVCGPDAPGDRRAALEARGVRPLPAADLREALRALRNEGVRSMLCEGGGRLASALLGADAVDRMSLFYAPVLLGPGGLAGFPGIADAAIAEAHRWRHLESRSLEPDTLIVLTR